MDALFFNIIRERKFPCDLRVNLNNLITQFNYEDSAFQLVDNFFMKSNIKTEMMKLCNIFFSDDCLSRRFCTFDSI